jgi:hypothetical protein
VNQRAQHNLRLQKIAEYWVRQVPDRELVRKCAWDQAEREGLQFDRKEVNAALRRAWNRTPDEERDALMAATTAAEPTSAIVGASSSYVPPGPGQGPGRESRPGPGPGGLQRGGEGCAPGGAVPDFGAYEAETYELLARYEAGLLRPRPVGLGAMPTGASEAMRAVAADIALLIGLRLAVDDDRPLIYSARFCAWRMGWTILSGEWDKRRANRVINKMLEAGVIEWVGEMPRSKARLYAPAPLKADRDRTRTRDSSCRRRGSCPAKRRSQRAGSCGSCTGRSGGRSRGCRTRRRRSGQE